MEGGDCGLILGAVLPLEFALRDSEEYNKNIKVISLLDDIRTQKPWIRKKSVKYQKSHLTAHSYLH